MYDNVFSLFTATLSVEKYVALYCLSRSSVRVIALARHLTFVDIYSHVYIKIWYFTRMNLKTPIMNNVFKYNHCYYIIDIGNQYLEVPVNLRGLRLAKLAWDVPPLHYKVLPCIPQTKWHLSNVSFSMAILILLLTSS